MVSGFMIGALKDAKLLTDEAMEEAREVMRAKRLKRSIASHDDEAAVAVTGASHSTSATGDSSRAS